MTHTTTLKVSNMLTVFIDIFEDGVIIKTDMTGFTRSTFYISVSDAIAHTTLPSVRNYLLSI